jgi:hypothetical protein
MSHGVDGLHDIIIHLKEIGYGLVQWGDFVGDRDLILAQKNNYSLLRKQTDR